jgi:octaprenyl-diphosphate synthase
LQEDLLDYTADAGPVGKTVGKDFFEGKVTWPWLTLYQRAPESQKTWMQTLIHNEDQRHTALPTIKDLMTQHDVFIDMHRLVLHHTRQAEAALATLPSPAPIHGAFREILQVLAERGG